MFSDAAEGKWCCGAAGYLCAAGRDVIHMTHVRCAITDSEPCVSGGHADKLL